MSLTHAIADSRYRDRSYSTYWQMAGAARRAAACASRLSRSLRSHSPYLADGGSFAPHPTLWLCCLVRYLCSLACHARWRQPRARALLLRPVCVAALALLVPAFLGRWWRLRLTSYADSRYRALSALLVFGGRRDSCAPHLMLTRAIALSRPTCFWWQAGRLRLAYRSVDSRYRALSSLLACAWPPSRISC